MKKNFTRTYARENTRFSSSFFQHFVENIIFFSDYWRMVMSKEEFIITPGCYDRQLDCDYRFSNETVTYDQLEDAREKCMDWILLNKEHFSL